MKKAAHLFEGCSLAAVVLMALAILGGVAVFHSFVTGLPFLQSEADRAQAHITALQAQRQAWLDSRWEPIITASRAVGTVVFWQLPTVALGGFLWHLRRKARLTYPRGDGLWGIPTRDLMAHPELAVKAAEAFHATEMANARRALPAAHVHMTTAAANQLAAIGAEQEAAHATEQPFSELMANGEFNGD